MGKLEGETFAITVIFELSVKFHIYGVYFSTADPYKTDRLIESSALCYHCYISMSQSTVTNNNNLKYNLGVST